ncbi:MAG: hypothetical protein LWX51_17620 [Deltaproteobacteria bacterium]|jgi:hypothetical protein|nr:hypothetical protein [Deltaproteobacteria bacterium]
MLIARGISTDPKTQVGFYGDLHQVSHQYYEMVEGRVLAQRRIVRLPRTQRNRFPIPYVNSKRKSKAGLFHYETRNAEATHNLLQRMSEKE